MRVVQVEGVKYYVQDEVDLISIAHELARKGYTVQQIANFLNISERKVKKMMEDCWVI